MPTNGCRVSLWSAENALKLNSGDGFITLEYTENYSVFQRGEFYLVMGRIVYHPFPNLYAELIGYDCI